MGPFPATHRRMELEVIGIFRISRGKLAELWVTWDNLAALGQLGLMPSLGGAKKRNRSPSHEYIHICPITHL